MRTYSFDGPLRFFTGFKLETLQVIFELSISKSNSQFTKDKNILELHRLFLTSVT